MPKKLKSLKSHEKEFQERHKFIAYGIATPCGIACPKCKTELMADYTISLTSNPPQTPVHCPKCDYRGSIH